MTAGTLATLARPYDSEALLEDVAAGQTAVAARTSNFAEGATFAFGDFQLVARSRLLLRDGRSVCLGSRAFDLLHALLRSAGTLVPKEALVRDVWPNTFVDESNLRFQMTCLRKALGNEGHFIKTIPGRGYVFTGHCSRVDSRLEQPAVLQAASARGEEAISGRTQLLPLPLRFTKSKLNAGAQSNPHGVWHLVSVSTVRASGETPPYPPGETVVSAVQDHDAKPTRIELLLPMLVFCDHADAGELPQPREATQIDMTPLLELLCRALHCGAVSRG